MQTIINDKSRYNKTLLQMNKSYTKDRLEYINDYIERINELKKEKNAVILAHYYMRPELQITGKNNGIADFTGDSLGLSIEAAKTNAEHIVFCGVKFMAETAAILNPHKKVLLPSFKAGCSLASSINAQDVRNLKKKYPGVPVIAYINTYAETKAESDICCTSRNALGVAEYFDNDRLIFIPDYFMGKNLQEVIRKKTGKELILWSGKCEVHEQFTLPKMKMFMAEHPDSEILIHWEVPDDTAKETLADIPGIVGSTGDILNYVSKSKAKNFILGSECDLGATIKSMFPSKTVNTPCILCPHMKEITLENTLNALESIGNDNIKDYEVKLDEEIRSRAEIPLRRMLSVS